MAECRQLSSDGFDDGRMSVSEDVDGDSGKEVDVLLAVASVSTAPSPRTRATRGTP
ncbi:hypothetical protein N806_15195 [Rhodococcus sp. P27]|nr:hypothetical protein N806_15195 [Rhodococcus sp. P27]